VADGRSNDMDHKDKAIRRNFDFHFPDAGHLAVVHKALYDVV
jgi:hypothetical protein